MKTLILFALFLVSFSVTSLAWACTKGEAIRELERDLLRFQKSCQIIEVADRQADWLGYEYYLITFDCLDNDDNNIRRRRRVYEDPKNGGCFVDSTN